MVRALVPIGTFVVALVLCGALSDPFLPGEVAFSTIEREHFDALAVTPTRGAPSPLPLVLRVHVLGDAADVDLTHAFGWLAKHANIVVIEDARGAPLFLTTRDLAATSGRGTLGATIPTGMAVEYIDPRIADCVVVHEVLHFVGLKHVDARSNIMYPHCSKDFLEKAKLEPAQRAQVDSVRSLRATMATGMREWAARGA